MSIKWLGLASRSFIMGIRLWPPLRILASSPCCCSIATASGRVLGRRYSKAGGIMFHLFQRQNTNSDELFSALFGEESLISQRPQQGKVSHSNYAVELWRY